MKPNPEMPGVYAGAGLFIVGLLLVLLPPVVRVDMMAAGYAMQFLGFFLVVAGAIVAAIFIRRARRLNALMAGRGLLARWVCPAEAQVEQAEREFQTAKWRNRLLLLIIGAWMAVMIPIFLFIDYSDGNWDDMSLFVAIMLGVLLLVGAFAAGMPYLQRLRALRTGGETVIATNALFVNGVLHTWEPPLAQMDGVELVEDGEQPCLVFHLRSLDRTNVTLYQPYDVEALVPPGQEEAARRVERYFEKG